LSKAWAKTRDYASMLHLLRLVGRDAEADRVSRVILAYNHGRLSGRGLAEHVRCMGIGPPTLAEVVAAHRARRETVQAEDAAEG
jgi:hypothetical protein